LHVHTPGTAHADQYPNWDEFLNTLKAEKEVAVVGVTDYLSITNYEHLLKLKGASKLGSIELLVPNIEWDYFRMADNSGAS
jgi:hypothetical protein